MISRFCIAALIPGICAALFSLLSSSSVHAQSGGGLTLGQPETATESTLDLGVAPSKDAQQPAEPAQTVEPAQPAAPAGPVATESSTPSGRVKHGAWEVACDAAGKNCAMAQIGNDAGGTPVLEMVLRKLEEPLEVGESTAIAVLDVITPLGVVLIEGLSVAIDGGRNETAQFQICTEQGCLVREPVDNDLITRLKRGNNAVVSVVAANQGEVKASLSLSGFTKAFNSLK